eukprot:6197463-Pleurochrysis_carterae.AAC.2
MLAATVHGGCAALCMALEQGDGSSRKAMLPSAWHGEARSLKHVPNDAFGCVPSEASPLPSHLAADAANPSNVDECKRARPGVKPSEQQVAESAGRMCTSGEQRVRVRAETRKGLTFSLACSVRGLSDRSP